MWETIATIALMLVKFVFEMRDGKKLDLDNFIKTIEAHEVRRARVAQSTEETEDAIEDLLNEPDEPSNPE